MTSSRYGTNFRTFAGSGTYSRHFYATYSYLTSSVMSWPYWYAGDYLDFTFIFSSVSGDWSTADQLYVSATYIWSTAVYYSSNNAQCGCYDPYGDGCWWYYSCYHYYGWDT